MSIPSSINYRNVKPFGVPSRVKKVRFFPQNLYSEIKPNDIVRFHIKAPTFWDPYNCFIKMKVSFEDMSSTGVLQLDGSAHSFINELVISAGSIELERITEYDVLASFLNDAAYDNSGRLSKQHEGLSGEILPSTSINQFINPVETFYSGTSSYMTAVNGFKPTIRPTSNSLQTAAAFGGVTSSSDTTLLNIGKNPVNIGNFATNRAAVETSIRRADEGFLSFRKKGHPGTYEPVREWPSNKVAATSYYQPSTSSDYRSVGPSNVFSNEFSSGSFEDCFSKTVTETLMKNGKVSTPEQVSRTSAEYCFPLLSGILGILMPRDQYKLFPAFAIENLTLEFRINPYAVFSSGYTNPTPGGGSTLTDSIFHQPLTAASLITRTFKIIEFELIVDLVQFDDSVTNLMRNQLSGDGLVISSHSWALGPLYNIPSTSGVLGTWQVNMGFESLKTIFMIFLSNDYLTYPFCRKLFKLSRNITSIQVKIGLEYFPDQPLEGHGGNPYALAKNEENNWIYLYELHKLFGTLNDTLSGTIMNRHNFAVNERPYNVTLTTPYLVSGSAAENNVDTAAGFPLIHENRVVGRSVYVLNLAYNSDSTMLNGVNTIQNRPFDISLKADGINVNPTLDRASTMMLFCHYDFVVQISTSGVRVLGRS